MPSVSKKQQSMMGIATGIKKGKTSPAYSPAAAKVAKSMTMGDLREFASTPRKGLPKKAPKPNKNNRRSPLPSAKGGLPKMK